MAAAVVDVLDAAAVGGVDVILVLAIQAASNSVGVNETRIGVVSIVGVRTVAVLAMDLVDVVVVPVIVLVASAELGMDSEGVGVDRRVVLVVMVHGRGRGCGRHVDVELSLKTASQIVVCQDLLHASPLIICFPSLLLSLSRLLSPHRLLSRPLLLSDSSAFLCQSPPLCFCFPLLLRLDPSGYCHILLLLAQLLLILLELERELLVRSLLCPSPPYGFLLFSNQPSQGLFLCMELTGCLGISSC